MTQWLLDRLFEKKDQPDPRFAFQGTVNWMGALAFLVNESNISKFSDENINEHYKNVQRRAINEDADTIVFENMLMAFHNYASLESMNRRISEPYDLCRSAIIAWYYSIYFTSSAMIAAASGSKQETHAQTVKVWQKDIIDNNLVLSPFSLNLSSLVATDVENKISFYRSSNVYDLGLYPTDHEQAWGGACSYLKGTAKYEKWRIEERLRSDKDFKALNVDNFRKKVARELRDSRLIKQKVNFVGQAFRYRGKANYRDSIFLSYGRDQSDQLETLCKDLETVSAAFIRMASCYLSKRVERGVWQEFITDLDNNSRLSITTDILKT